MEEIQELRNNLSGLLGNNGSMDPKGNYVYFKVRDNNHFLIQIKSLLEICVLALDGEGMMLSPGNQNASKEESVIQVLELILSILPDGQMYFLDQLDEMLMELQN